MNKLMIQEKLRLMGIDLSSIALGDFDSIGRFTAEKERSPSDPLYRTVGRFFRPNYERGLLIYSLIRKFRLKSYLELGFGRGYSALCAAKAFHDLGIDGTVMSVEPNIDENHIEFLSKVFPKELLERVEIMKGTSEEVVPRLEGSWDLVYIDGDHRAPAVQGDWEMLQGRWNEYLLFDDYHLPTKKETHIECAQVIDGIVENGFKKELIVTDRRVFFDDRRIPDENVDYGIVMLTKNRQQELDW